MIDPDPFDDRHPSRIDSNCPLGHILKCFFKKEPLVAEIFNNYLRDNYFTRLGQSKSSFDLNVATCRVVLGILPGLEIQVLSDTEGLIKRLFDWAKKSVEPLQSYATGLLGVCMEIQEITTDPEFRIQNDALIPVMIQRLKSFKAENLKSDHFKRPFSMLSNGHERRFSSDFEAAETSRGSMPELSELSNSSWAEMESQLIGHFPIFPLTLSAQQVFILRYLQPLAEYQDFLQHINDENIPELLADLINLRDNRDARLSFESLRFLCALFCHKKICLDWVQNNGISMLIDVPRPSIAATAVSQCLYYLSCDDSTMEKVCQLPQNILHKMIK